MSRNASPGWWAFSGGLALGAALTVLYFQLATFEDAWLAITPVALVLVFAGIPYREGPHGRAARAPWRYGVSAVGIALAAGALVGHLVTA